MADPSTERTEPITGRLIEGSWHLEHGDEVGFVNADRLDTSVALHLVARLSITGRVAATSSRPAYLTGTFKWTDRGPAISVTVPLADTIRPRKEHAVGGYTGGGIGLRWLTYLLDKPSHNNQTP